MGFLDDVINDAEHAWDSGKKSVGRTVNTVANLAGEGLHDVGLDSLAHDVERAGETAADLLGATPGEKSLDQTDDPKELIHGDPSAIRDRASKLHSLSGHFEDAGQGLRGISVGNWEGSGGDAYHAKVNAEFPKWFTAADASSSAASALGTLADIVEWAQGRAAEAVRIWKQAVAEHNSWVAAAKPGLDPASELKDEANRILKSAREQRNTVAQDVAGHLNSAADEAPPLPSASQRMIDDVKDQGTALGVADGHMLAGALETVGGLVKLVRSVDPADPYNANHPAEYLRNASAVAAGLSNDVAHPAEFVKSFIGTGWSRDPAQALGALSTNVAMMFIPGGEGAGAVSAGAKAAADAGEAALTTGMKAAGEASVTDLAMDAGVGAKSVGGDFAKSVGNSVKDAGLTDVGKAGVRTVKTAEKAGESGADVGEASEAPHDASTPAQDPASEPVEMLHDSDGESAQASADSTSPAQAPEIEKSLTDTSPATPTESVADAPLSHATDPVVRDTLSAPGADESPPAPASIGPAEDSLPSEPVSPGNSAARTEPVSPTYSPVPEHEPLTTMANTGVGSHSVGGDVPRTSTPTISHSTDFPSHSTDSPRPSSMATSNAPRVSTPSALNTPVHAEPLGGSSFVSAAPTAGSLPLGGSADAGSAAARSVSTVPLHPPNAVAPRDVPAVDAAVPGDVPINPGGSGPIGPTSGAHYGESGGAPPYSLTEEAAKNEAAVAQSTDASSSVEPGSKHVAGEPVDVATGEYLLPATDVTLPGVLPLVLARCHRSLYEHGVWFGRRWSSTFDARALVVGDVVVTIDTDGVMLRFPRPVDDETTTPMHGGAWQLSRSAGGGYRLYSVDARRSLFFDPNPAVGGEDLSRGVLSISAIVDAHRNRVLFEFDHRGVPMAVESSSGHRVEVDSNGARITGYRLASGRVIREFGYTAGELTSVTDAAGAASHFFYDAAARMRAWTDSVGQRFENVYDGTGRVVSQRGRGGVWSGEYSYRSEPDGSGSVTTYTDAEGDTTVYGIDADRQIRRIADPGGGVTAQSFNALREPLEVTAPDGGVTRYLYHTTGDLAQVIAADGTSTQIAYVAPRLPSEVRGSDNSVTRYGYDKAGNVTEITDSLGAVHRREYNSSGALVAATDPLGRRTQYQVNSAGQPVAIIDALRATTTVDYDDRGLAVAITDPAGAQTRIEYDGEGRMTRRVDADGATQTWEYDGEGNCIAHVDAAGAVTRWSFGFYDKPVARVDPDGSRTDFVYDRARRLVGVFNPRGLRWTYEYGPDGRLASETDFDGATTRYAYDVMGRVSWRLNGAGQVVVYERDLLGRVISETAGLRTPDGQLSVGQQPDVTYSYDPVGRLVSARNSVTQLDYSHNAVGRVVSERWDGIGPGASWNAAGDLTGLMHPSGLDVTVTYDPRGVVEGLLAGDIGIGFTTDRLGREIRRTIGHSAIDSTWDALGRLTGRTLVSDVGVGGPLNIGIRPAERVVAGSEFGYRSDGVLASVAGTADVPDLVPAARFELDALARVTRRVRTDGVESYSYDTSSNITRRDSGVPGGLEWQYEGMRLIDDSRSRYSYDGAGRVVQVVTKRASRRADVWRYEWDAWDRLVAAVMPDGGRYAYGYDALGRRVSKTAPDGVVTQFWWWGSQLIEQTDSVGAQSMSWVFMPGALSPAAQLSQSDVDRQFYAIVSDQMGMPVSLVNSDVGVVAGTASASLWGEVLWSGVSTPLRYPGQYADEETGLSYNLFRYYNPHAGRFLSPDPLGLAPSPNNYAYPPNPMVWCDPLGLVPCGGGGNRPPNLAPEGAGRRGAFGQAKRDLGIPRSRPPDEVRPNLDRVAQIQPGRLYVWREQSRPDLFIRDDSAGHVYPEDPSQNRGPHFNTPNGGHYDY